MVAALVLQDMNALAGSSGWIGAGLLGVVLGWLLMVRWPANDKQVQGLIESKDKQVHDLLDTYMRRDDAHIADQQAWREFIADQMSKDRHNTASAIDTAFARTVASIGDVERRLVDTIKERQSAKHDGERP